MIAGPLLVALMLFAAPDPVDPAPATVPDAAGAADALAPVTVTTRVVPDPSHVGDLLTLEVTAAFARGSQVVRLLLAGNSFSAALAAAPPDFDLAGVLTLLLAQGAMTGLT